MERLIKVLNRSLEDHGYVLPRETLEKVLFDVATAIKSYSLEPIEEPEEPVEGELTDTIQGISPEVTPFSQIIIKDS